MRHFTDPGAIEHVAAVWGIDPADMPGPGEPIFKQLERMEAGEIRGLINICSNPMVSWPDQARVRRILEGLDLYRSEEHTSELQSLMRISYAVFCLKKTKEKQHRKI